MNQLFIKDGNKSISVTNYVSEFLNYIDVSGKTKETYKIALRQFCDYLLGKGINAPTREDIIEYREELKKDHKPNTVNGYLIAVRNLYDYLEYEGITKNITKKVKGIKLEQKHLKRGLSKEEIDKVLNVCKNLREELMIKMMINLGLRCNELVNIQLEDFYDDKGIVMLKVLGKARNGLKQDSIKVDDRLFEMIKEYVEQYNIKDYLFTSTSNHNKDGKLTTKTIRVTITDLFKKAGLDMNMLSTHSTRHTTCELLLENGVDLREVSQFMRHKSINTTTIYAKEISQRNSQTSNLLANMLFS
jgi:integrase/recombinase XerC